MFSKIGHIVRQVIKTTPWSRAYAIGRTLLAVGTIATLAFNPLDVLFVPATGGQNTPFCPPRYGVLSIFCITAREHLDIVRWIAVGILLITASGWRPRLTSLPQWWIAYSLFVSSTVKDGGDQVTLVLSTLLLPVCILDGRKWQWTSRLSALQNRDLPRLIAYSSLLAIRIQVAGIYFVAAISKLAVPEWVDGTALYYWASFFKAPSWLITLFSYSLPVLFATWGGLAIEITLASAILLRKEHHRYFFLVGLIFHLLIALLFGFWSFSIAMVAALLLYIPPVKLANETAGSRT